MRSMTGYGTGQVLRGGWDVTVELKAVNHRFLDIAMRPPKNIAFLEQPIREQISRTLKRGHVEVFLTVRDNRTARGEIGVDLDLARQYMDAGREIAAAVGAKNDLTVSKLMEFEGVAERRDSEMDPETVTTACSEALEIALAQMVNMREKEGKRLREDLKAHLAAIASLQEKIAERAPGVVEDYRERLEQRIRQLGQEQADGQRLAMEVALMADRCAIDEELVRLKSHLKQMETFLKAKDEIGKKMDFLIQEMNREANTIGSKASDVQISKCVVEMKSEIEKLREQIQNVE